MKARRWLILRRVLFAYLMVNALAGTALAAASGGGSAPVVVHAAPFGPQWLWWGGMVVGVFALALTIGRRQPTHWTQADTDDQRPFLRD